jgi:hypothetical protein
LVFLTITDPGLFRILDAVVRFVPEPIVPRDERLIIFGLIMELAVLELPLLPPRVVEILGIFSGFKIN